MMHEVYWTSIYGQLVKADFCIYLTKGYVNGSSASVGASSQALIPIALPVKECSVEKGVDHTASVTVTA